MKKIRLGITILSALLMIPNQMAWAAWDAGHKSAFNKYLKENFKGTYNDFYRNHAMSFDEDSRGLMEMWLRNYGKTTMAQPQAVIIRDKTGKDTLKLLFNQAGRTLTLTFTEGNYQSFDANGQKIPFGNIRNIPTVLTQLAETDGSLVPLEKAAKSNVIQVPRKSDVLSVGQFAKLTRLQRVQYLMLLRQSVEAAQAVHDEAANANATAQRESASSSLFVFHPLFASQIAWASGSAVKENDKCIVAGNVSVYEKEGGHMACAAFPVKNPQGFQPQPTFHDRCTGKGKGRMVACNPLLYGTADSGEPFCVDSGDQPRFTQRATADCNNKSPLHGEPNSPARLADYEKILKSYFLLKGNSADKLKDCFNEDHKIAQSCKGFFEGQYNDFVQFKNDAEKICTTVKLKDQFKACDELKKRALDLITFLESIDVPGHPPVATIDLIKDGCIKGGFKWDDQMDDCFCPNAKRAKSLGGNQFECPVADNPPTPPVAPIEKKDDCKKENGEQSHSFKCDPAPWLFGIITIGALAFWLTRDHDKPNQPPGQPPQQPPVLPPPVVVVNPGSSTTTTTNTTMAPPTTQVPATPVNEGSNGQNPGSTGGGAVAPRGVK